MVVLRYGFGLLIALALSAPQAAEVYVVRHNIGIASIDLENGSIIDEFAETESTAAAVSADGQVVYLIRGIGSSNSGQFRQLSADLQLLGDNSLGAGAFAIVLSPDQARAFVIQPYGTPRLRVMNTSTLGVARTVNLDSVPAAIAVHPDGSEVFLAIPESNQVARHETVDWEVTATIEAGKAPGILQVTPDGRRLLVGNMNDRTVDLFDITTPAGRKLASFDVGVGPVGLVITADGRRAYASAFYSRSVSRIDLENLDVQRLPVALASNPAGLALTPDQQRLLVALPNANEVVQIDRLNGQMADPTIAISGSPIGFAVRPDPNPYDQPALRQIVHLADDVLIAVSPTGGLARSDDGGQTWNIISDGLPDTITLTALVAVDGQVLAGSARHGLFRSTDAGLSWTPHGQGIGNRIRHLSNDAVEPGVVLAGTNSGVLISSDGGATWSAP
ncbi:MAG: hypothetical protein EA370_07670 [Wenzhouxiangella sp.]|nr:MAG: hypothetical protein EA370_07670 [Wenzhouxiangella sp.]